MIEGEFIVDCLRHFVSTVLPNGQTWGQKSLAGEDAGAAAGYGHHNRTWLADCPVPNKQWRACTGSGGCLKCIPELAGADMGCGVRGGLALKWMRNPQNILSPSILQE